jgi:uncharacterized protein
MKKNVFVLLGGIVIAALVLVGCPKDKSPLDAAQKGLQDARSAVESVTSTAAKSVTEGAGKVADDARKAVETAAEGAIKGVGSAVENAAEGAKDALGNVLNKE